jgi:hypothetical protein
MTDYTKYPLSGSNSCWVMMDRFGNKSKVTLSTNSGQLITRTVQFYRQVGSQVEMQITYKGERVFVNEFTILED